MHSLNHQLYSFLYPPSALLQFHKQVRIEGLAACLPLAILYESCRRHIQRFLILSQLSIPIAVATLIRTLPA
jgi:hypothetical protein